MKGVKTISRSAVGALLAAVAMLAGCASSGPIPMGNDTYMISQTSAGGNFHVDVFDQSRRDEAGK